MVVNNVLLKSVTTSKVGYPDDEKPEIAFVGKSNVGKSSLINTMISRKALARTSQNPGKTRTINFYEIEEQLYFVDLPGYGFAKASKSEIEKWGKMIEEYLLKRQELRVIVQLVDIRHEPSANDKLMYNWINHYNYNTILVLTKADKLSRNEKQKNISLIKKTFQVNDNKVVIPFSSQDKTGKDELWKAISDNI